ncbi:MAG: hypothetical protein JXA14_20850, partial [Anaerolineae bacterium]|nr:hypothetical protein [Anaerolineae bacterium]
MLADTQPSPSRREKLSEPQQATLAALLKVDDTTILELSRLTLPEIRAIKEEIARVFPAGNLPAFLLSGLIKLKGRRVSPEQVTRDLTALLRGVDLIPQGLYGALIAGPAAAIHVYQKVLQLAGKDVDNAFPEGTWQFYLQFGLREDTARHANETVGFHRALSSEQRYPIQMAAAWVCAALELLYRYDDLLLTDWTERVMLRLLTEEAVEAGVVDQPPFSTLERDWYRRCPYRRPNDGSDYVSHRQAVFQQVLEEVLPSLPRKAQGRFQQRYQARLPEELLAYQQQMTLLAALKPDRYQESREFIPLWRAAVAFIWQDCTYLTPACRQNEQGSPLCYPPRLEDATPVPLYLHPEKGLCDGSGQPVQTDRNGRVTYRDGRLLGVLRPPAPEMVLSWVAGVLAVQNPGPPPTLDLLLADTPRSFQHQLRQKLPAATQVELAALRRSPIVVNWDRRPHELPLAYVRRGRRSIGDHALTVFRTDHSFVFDQSHVFFDGVWGMAVAEVMTDSAVHWYHSLVGRHFIPQTPPPQPLVLKGSPKAEASAQAQRRSGEVAAESSDVDMRSLAHLRKWLGQRGVRLTINDLLLLYRFFHAASYESSPQVRQALEAFSSQAKSPQVQAALETIGTTLARLRETNPALLIPMSASSVSPRERVFPTTFRNPLVDIREKLTVAHESLQACRDHADPNRWAAFDRARRELLAYLKAFGQVLDALKAVTMRGESFNTATIRMLAHLPASMQHLMDGIPQRVGALNEIIKGNEVFSNVGRVAPGSTI